MRYPRGGVPQRHTRSKYTATSGDVSRPSPSPIHPPFDYPSAALNVGGRRDSDASSLCSSHFSSIGTRSANPYSNPSDKASLIRIVNSYLATFSPPGHLKPPLPSQREISEAFIRIFSRLDSEHHVSDLTRDLPSLLAVLRCPVKLSKSALKAPATPHAWPSVLSVLHWLVQLACVADHIVSCPGSPTLPDYDLNQYIMRTYSLFVVGDDCTIEDLDAEYFDRLKRHSASAVEADGALEIEAVQSQARLRDLIAGPSPLEAVEAERAALLEDSNKQQNALNKLSATVESITEKVAEMEKTLEAKEAEKRRLDAENEDSRQRIRDQTLSARDMERMTKEFQAISRDIAEGESRRNDNEEKLWSINSERERVFRGIDGLTEQCNQAIKKLKIGNNFQHALNAEASSATELIGIDYKTVLKPALNSQFEEAKNSKASKADELSNLKKKSLECDSIHDGKKAQCAAIQTKVIEVEAQADHFKMEMEEHTLKYSSENEKLIKELASKVQQLDTMERDAKQLLIRSNEKLKMTDVTYVEDTQFCVQEIYTLIDSVSQYKEFMESIDLSIREDIKEMSDLLKHGFQLSIK